MTRTTLQLRMLAGDYLHVNTVLAETPGMTVGVKHQDDPNVYVYANSDDSFELLERVGPDGTSTWLACYRDIPTSMQGTPPDLFNLAHRSIPTYAEWDPDKTKMLAWGVKIRLNPHFYGGTNDEEES